VRSLGWKILLEDFFKARLVSDSPDGVPVPGIGHLAKRNEQRMFMNSGPVLSRIANLNPFEIGSADRDAPQGARQSMGPAYRSIISSRANQPSDECEEFGCVDWFFYPDGARERIERSGSSKPDDFTKYSS